MAEFDCPRCGHAVEERFFGPCQGCRQQLNEQLAGEGSDQYEGTARFEPAMHVVPNHVATKD